MLSDEQIMGIIKKAHEAWIESGEKTRTNTYFYEAIAQAQEQATRVEIFEFLDNNLVWDGVGAEYNSQLRISKKKYQQLKQEWLGTTG